MRARYGVHSMPETADNVAADYGVSRADQDAFALRSQQRWASAQGAGVFADEIAPVRVPQGKGEPLVVDRDEHPRPDTTPEQLAKLKPLNGPDKAVTAGNASGVNDGAAALIVASEAAARAHGLTPEGARRRHGGGGRRAAHHGRRPDARRRARRSPAPACALDQMDVIELNEAFAAQALAVLRELGLADDAPHVNPNGGAIAIGHPLGMSGARLVATAMYQLRRQNGRYALCTMCIGVGQGIALILERV